MKYTILLIFISSFLFSCESEKKETIEPNESTEVKLDQQNQTILEKNKPESNIEAEPKAEIEIKGNIYTEFYPGTKRIKFQGPQDENGKRDGKWMFFDEKGVELSMTNYKNGQKHGATMVKYPNGNIHYTGEYTNDQTTGIWTTYSEVGEKLTVKNFDDLK